MNGRINRRRLYRDPERGWIGGVCAGIAAYLAVPVFWVRLLTVLPLFSPLMPLSVLRIPVPPDELYESDEQREFLHSLNAAPSTTFGELRHRMRDLEHRVRRMEAYVTSPEFDFEQGMRQSDEAGADRRH